MEPDARLSRVITVSDRSAAHVREDVSGPTLVEGLRDAGWRVSLEVVADGRTVVEEALRRALDDGVRFIVTTGGTGVGPRDETPEGTIPVLDRQLLGVAEALRARGMQANRMAALSRGVAGVVDARDGRHGALIVNLPGSTTAVREGLEVLVPLAGHILDQLGGGDH